MSDLNVSRKIFVSYKYSDSGVAPLNIAMQQGEVTQARHYVTVLENLLDVEDHIYKGEKDDEPLDQFKEETIESKLRNKIFDSTVTIVLISKNMKDIYLEEKDQWIPWEISYSLKEMTKDNRTSGTNAILAVVIPDENSDYSYMVNHYSCVTIWNTAGLFKILHMNMFNRNECNLIQCKVCGGTHHSGNDHSYVFPVKWDDFIKDINSYINHVVELKANIQDFNISKIINNENQ